MSTTKTNHGIDQNEKESAEYSRPETTWQQTFVPRIDIWEGQNELVLQADIPGVQPDSVDIRYEDNQLTIHGQVHDRYGNRQLSHSEYSIGDFHRTFRIGESIDSEKISAEVSGGVLTLHLPKTEKVRPRRIEVRAK